MEFNIDCNNCGGKKFTIIYPSIHNKLKPYQRFSAAKAVPSKDQIVKCNDCGLVFVNPQPKQSVVVKGYQEGHEEGYVSQEEQRMKTFDNCLDFVKKFCKKGKILDVGCASGFFVKVAHDRGWNAFGVEPNKWMVEWGKKRFKIKITQGTLKDIKDSFDVITMWDVLEHTSNPMNELNLASKKLEKGGILIINFPDYSSVFSRVFKRKWWFVLSNHFYYFTPRTLKEMVEKNGFKVITFKKHWQSLSFDYLVNMFKHLTSGKGLAGKIYSSMKFLSDKGIKNLKIKYWAGQTLLVAEKK